MLILVIGILGPCDMTSHVHMVLHNSEEKCALA